MLNTKIKTHSNLFIPSVPGVLAYTFLSGLIILLHQFSVVERYLQIPGNVDFTRMFTGWLDRSITNNFGENLTASLVVGFFWAMVGLGVYLLLRGLARLVNDFSEGFAQRGYLWPQGASRNQRLLEAAQQAAVRVVAFLGLVYMLVGPLARLLGGWLIVDLSRPVLMPVWFAAVWLCLHVCVVLMRLIVLKSRLLG